MKKQISRKMIAAILLMLGSCSSMKAQTQCTLNVGLTNIVQSSDVTGTGVINTSSLVIRGNGYGPINVLGSSRGGFNFASQSLSGDFTAVSRVTSLTVTNTARTPEVGILGMTSGSHPVFTEMSIFKWNGNFFLQVQYSARSTQWAWNNVYLAQISDPATSPLWLKLTRTSGVFTAYSSSNGTSYTPLASGFSPGGTDPTSIGIFADSGDPTIGNFGNGTLDNISINASGPVFTDADVTNSGGSAGDAGPILPFTFTETASGSLNYSNSGVCSPTQQTAIASAESSGHFQLQVGLSLTDLESGTPVITSASTTVLGQLVCATCSEPQVQSHGTSSNLFFKNPQGYWDNEYITPNFDNTFVNTLSAANVILSNPGLGFWSDGHPAAVQAHNQGSRASGGYYLGAAPNYECSTASAPPDYQPVFVLADYEPYYLGASYCKRSHGSPAGTPWSCGIIGDGTPFIVGIPLRIPLFPCTNFDKGIDMDLDPFI